MINYLKRLCVGQKLLWCYLIWYLSIVVMYFDADMYLWLSALGISLIVGFALVLSTSCWPVEIRTLDRWKTFRLFFIPFCVSSYSLLISHKNFVLIFPPELKTNLVAIFAITVFLISVGFIQKRVD